MCGHIYIHTTIYIMKEAKIKANADKRHVDEVLLASLSWQLQLKL